MLSCQNDKLQNKIVTQNIKYEAFFERDTTFLIRGFLKKTPIELIVNYIKGFDENDERLMAHVRIDKENKLFFYNMWSRNKDTFELSKNRECKGDDSNYEQIVINKNAQNHFSFTISIYEKDEKYELRNEHTKSSGSRMKDVVKASSMFYEVLMVDSYLDTLSLDKTIPLVNLYNPHIDGMMASFMDTNRFFTLNKKDVLKIYLNKVNKFPNIQDRLILTDTFLDFRATYPIAFFDRYVVFETQYGKSEARRISFDLLKKKFVTLTDLVSNEKMIEFKRLLKSVAQQELCSETFDIVESESSDFKELKKFDL